LSTERQVRRLRPLLWVAGALLGVAAEWSLYGWARPRGWAPDLITGWTLIACGLVAWSRRQQSRSGMLMTATGFGWFAPNFASTGLGTLDWLSAHALYLHRGPLIQLVLTYPRGRSAGRLERVAVAAGYAVSLVIAVWQSELATIALSSVLAAVAARNYLRAVGPERRARRYALFATASLAAVFALAAAVRLAASGQGSERATLLLYQASLCALAFGLLAGLLRAPWERAAVADLVVELGETRSGTLRDALARALADPSLEVGYWLPELDGFVDATGRQLYLPEPGSGRSMTTVERDGRPLAVLVHDRAVLADPGLVEAVSSAAKLAAANARLQADVLARLAELRTSRRRILEAGDEERERLEGRLRDGAERQLDELAQDLQDARTSASEGTVERIVAAEAQLRRTQDELRRLARGINPRVLTEKGLAAALSSLAEESPIPIELAVSARQADPGVEACAYFVCSEALANVAKHASASGVRIVVSGNDGRLAVEIEDDGVGGADIARGSGLRGLADRVETLGGTLTVVSPPGGGTSLVAVIPTSSRPDSPAPDPAESNVSDARSG
jgi:signal transduction histidine kinase